MKEESSYRDLTYIKKYCTCMLIAGKITLHTKNSATRADRRYRRRKHAGVEQTIHTYMQTIND